MSADTPSTTAISGRFNDPERGRTWVPRWPAIGLADAGRSHEGLGEFRDDQSRLTYLIAADE